MPVLFLPIFSPSGTVAGLPQHWPATVPLGENKTPPKPWRWQAGWLLLQSRRNLPPIAPWPKIALDELGVDAWVLNRIGRTPGRGGFLMYHRGVPLRDAHNRSIRDLRVSLTDRCNFRCFYCLPNGEPPMARKDTILTFEEIEYLTGVFVSLGIEKVRLTGGEPLIRKDVPKLIAKLAGLKPALKDLALTTNGFDLPRHAAALKRAGLDRVTISLDSLDRQKFIDITGVDALQNVYSAIEAAKTFGFEPVKINAVIVRGRNDDELIEFARFAREQDVAMRFIEFMPLDAGHDWDRADVVPGREIRDVIDAVYPLKLRDASRGSETSWRYKFADGAPGEIGIIAPVTEMFCGACSRIRLTADGQIRTCLFSTTEHNLRDVVRGGAGRNEVVDFIENAVMKKEPRHYINDADFVQPSRTMSFIGG